MDFGNNDYFSGQGEYFNNSYLDTLEKQEYNEKGEPIQPDDSINFTTEQIGTATSPIGNALESLKARIKEGTGNIEFSFMGQGKGNSQQPTPESYGSAERRDMRELLKINDMTTATHAAVHNDSLAGFGRDGFNEEQRARSLNEIKKAIDFASEATRGGAIVFHLREWQRALSDLKDKDVKDVDFVGYEEEEKRSPLLVVDSQTGQAVSGISRDRTLYRLDYETVEDYEKRTGEKVKGENVRPDDWVDTSGNRIDKYANTEELFNRVPKWNEEKKNFEVKELKWKDLEEETKKYNEGRPKHEQIKPEVMYAKINLENKVHQQRGSSLYHGKNYTRVKQARDRAKDLKEKYENLRKELSKSGNEEHARQFLKNALTDKDEAESLANAEDPSKVLQEKIDYYTDDLRYIHEASGSADVQAREAQEVLDRLETVEDFGIKKTADTVAEAAMYAKEKYEANKDKYDLKKPIYVAPENWDPNAYGSHPDEYKNAIEESRKSMVNKLMQRNYSKEEAEKFAKTHIKGTLDIGHLNTYRKFIKKKDKHESEEQMHKRFEDWMIKKVEKLVKGGYVGHIHLSDNFGFDDEHLTPGQGNIPMKRFLKKMEELGMDDLIVEPGSYNIKTAVPDTLNHINSPVYGISRRTRSNQMRQAHFGYQAPGFFIAGSYSPSNEWKMWSDVPLE